MPVMPAFLSSFKNGPSVSGSVSATMYSFSDIDGMPFDSIESKGIHWQIMVVQQSFPPRKEVIHNREADVRVIHSCVAAPHF